MDRTYSVRIRWQLVGDHVWEIETEHSAFHSAEAAALFACGVGERAVKALRIQNGHLDLELTEGQHVEVEPTSVWQLKDRRDEPAVARDQDFVDMGAELGAVGQVAEGATLRPIFYCVLGPTGSGVDVKLSLKADGDVEVTVIEDETDAGDDPELVILPA